MKSGKTILTFLSFICFLQIVLTVYFIIKVYFSNVARPDEIKEAEGEVPAYDAVELYGAQDFVVKKNPEDGGHDLTWDSEFESKLERELLKSDPIKHVQIWGKAAIASYLWEHILGGTKTVDINDRSIYSAQIATPKCMLHYKEGPGLQIERLPDEVVEYLVLVLNGRTEEKVSESMKWVKFVGNLTHTPKLILVVLGNEYCENDWIYDLMIPKGPFYTTFITYDDPRIDNIKLFQWPLGVATYRYFPVLSEKDINPTGARKYICNLQATNYENSSRSFLFSKLKSFSLAQEYCHVVERTQWLPSESSDTSLKYLSILLQSDLTLCPAGFNTETYRVYEALSAGSVPVIEDVPSKGSCSRSLGWRLLKQYNAPVIWITDWNQLPRILEREAKIELMEKVRRRKKLLSWHEWFKVKNRDRLLSQLYKLF